MNSKFKKKPVNKKKGNQSFNRNRTESSNIDRSNQQSSNKEPKGEINSFIFSSPLSVTEFGIQINRSSVDIIKHLFIKKGVTLTLNTILNKEQIQMICSDFGLAFSEQNQQESTDILEDLIISKKQPLILPRPPIVTIMGHVDHGKTSLLDLIRKSKITQQEHGGITQHIGSYQIEYNNNKITFLDTPGHEAFANMRMRGASVTDLVVLVIAADDGIKPQTVEAINHSKAADVKIIVFINKMDKANANADLIKSQLYDQGVIVEDLGGDVLCIPGSVLLKQGIDELLEAIVFMSQILDLKADINQSASGSVIEAHLDKGYGPVATVMVQNGTLNKGDYLVLNSTTGRVRIMHNDQLKPVKCALPSSPVKIAGLDQVPSAGDKFIAVSDEKIAKELIEKTKQQQWKERIFQILNASDNDSSSNKVNIIIKTDVHGSLEAIKASLNKISVEGSYLNIVSCSVGGINESDIKLAKISGATIFGFNVKPNKMVRDLANQQKVNIVFHNVIYKLLDDAKDLLLGSLSPVEKEEILGEGLVQAIWTHSKIGTIAGLKVVSGKITRNAQVRVIRDQVVIYTSKISSLKHQKTDINQALVNTECGVVVENYNDIKVNDTLEFFEVKQVSGSSVLS